MTAPSREREREFEPVYHHYGPHRAGLPPLLPYFRELWHRRAFAAEMSKAVMRGANTSTFFGQLWLILNPLLLAGVYYLLVTIIRGRHEPAFFAHLCLSLFAFNLVSTAITTGAPSVTCSGKLLMNTPFPRLLIPLSAVRTAFFRFLPTIPVYLVFHVIFLTDVWHPKMLLSLYFLGTMVVFRMGWPPSSPRSRSTSGTRRASCRSSSGSGCTCPRCCGRRRHRRPVSKSLLTIIQFNPMYSMLGGYARADAATAIPPSTCGLPPRPGRSRCGDRLLVLHLEGA